MNTEHKLNMQELNEKEFQFIWGGMGPVTLQVNKLLLKALPLPHKPYSPELPPGPVDIQ